jgi:hypothetical protein
LKRENEYTACLYLPNRGGFKEVSEDRMIVVGRQGGKEANVEGAILAVFDCASDKFVKNPLVYTDEQFSDELGGEAFKISSLCLVNTAQYNVKNLVLATNRGTLRVINLPETRTSDLSTERFMKP